MAKEPFAPITRRGFLGALAIGGVGVGLGGFGGTIVDVVSYRNRGRKALHPIYGNSDTPEWLRDVATGELKPNPQWILRHTTDQQCHSNCGLRVKIDRKTGRVQRIIGNPYHPNTLIDYTSMSVPFVRTAAHPGTVCARGNAGIESAYDPYRVLSPLKRKGPRGSGKWQPISWKQLLREVVDGGKIFADTGDPASESFEVTGFRGLYAKRNELMNPAAPELGHRTNGFVLQCGRTVGARKEFAVRFGNAFGSVNVDDHVNVCELSHHVATDQVFPGKHMTQPDVVNAKFIIYWGTQPGDANFPMQTHGKYAAHARAKPDGLKYVVVDPHLSRGGVIGDRASWVAIKPSTDGALAMGMIRWIIENHRYDAAYLSHPAQKAAEAAGELSHTDATHLIIVDEKHPKYGRFLTSETAGLGGFKGDSAADRVVIDPAGRPVRAGAADTARMEYAGEVNGIRVKTAFTRIRESAEMHSLDEYSSICGVSKERMVELAREFTSYGRQAVSTMYRGVVKHPNGYYNGVSVLLLNLLVGNMNWTGGLTVGGGSWSYKKGLYDNVDVPEAKGVAYGVMVTRQGVRYEDTSEYQALVKAGKNPYPAKRPWWPFSFAMYTEVLPSGLQKYPYGIDILMWNMATPFYSVPSQGNPEIINLMKDPRNVPLIIASDIVVGDTSMYADYIVPDGSFLERWNMGGTLPTVLTKGTYMRWPVVELTHKTPDGRHMCLEAFLIDVAKRLNMPGFGDKGIRDKNGKWWPLNRKEDWYLKACANVALAAGHPDDEVPEVTAEEIEIMNLKPFHDRFKGSLPPEQWPKVLGLIARGGRFEPHSRAREGGKLTYRFGKTLHFYAEDVGITRNSMTGELYLGTTRWVTPATALGTPLDKLDPPEKWPLTIITFKGALQSHSRLVSNYTIREIMPDNGIEVSAEDAEHLGILDGDYVWVVTPEGRRRGRARVIQGIRPGVITFSVGYGHWGYGATQYRVGGKRIEGDRVRRMGILLNPIMRRDPDVWQMSLMDLTGGSIVFYNTRARLEKETQGV